MGLMDKFELRNDWLLNYMNGCEKFRDYFGNLRPMEISTYSFRHHAESYHHGPRSANMMICSSDELMYESTQIREFDRGRGYQWKPNRENLRALFF